MRRNLQRNALAGILTALLLDETTVASTEQWRDQDPRGQDDTLFVTSCADDGAEGTLRNVVAAANASADKNVVDLGQLQCSILTLTGGAIPITRADLRIQGPGWAKLSIDGNDSDRIFEHSAAGTLTIRDLTVQRGHQEGSYVAGGCIYSAGTIVLTRTVVRQCKAIGTEVQSGSIALGGALYASKVQLTESRVQDSEARAAGGNIPLAAGGGIFSGDLTMSASTISGNHAIVTKSSGIAYGGGAVFSEGTLFFSVVTGNDALPSTKGAYTYGGGLFSTGSTATKYSTIDHNSATYGGGFFSAGSITIANTTISSNSAASGGGAIFISGAAPFGRISNSTIAFNRSASGIYVTSTPLDIQSSILSGSAAVGGDFDLLALGSVTGANNLIQTHSPATELPQGTLEDDPQLEPLAYNGGITRTHALKPNSIAIDAGNNSGGFATDQRGPPYGRTFGPEADIGAFELERDHIFSSPFE